MLLCTPGGIFHTGARRSPESTLRSCRLVRSAASCRLGSQVGRGWSSPPWSTLLVSRPPQAHASCHQPQHLSSPVPSLFAVLSPEDQGEPAVPVTCQTNSCESSQNENGATYADPDQWSQETLHSGRALRHLTAKALVRTLKSAVGTRAPWPSQSTLPRGHGPSNCLFSLQPWSDATLLLVPATKDDCFKTIDAASSFYL